MHMKIKRIFAIIAVVLLVALYGSTIVFAMSDNPNAVYMFKASIFRFTVIQNIQLFSPILFCSGRQTRKPAAGISENIGTVAGSGE